MSDRDDVLAANAPEKFKIPLRHARGVDMHVDAGPETTVLEIIRVIATERGVLVEDLIIVREGEIEPLPHDHLICRDHSRRHCHHVHRRADVKVTVHYQSRSEVRDFRRQEPLEDVLLWACDRVGIDETLVGEFQLVLVGEKEEIPLREHVGHVAGERTHLEFNLSRGDIANGAVL